MIPDSWLTPKIEQIPDSLKKEPRWLLWGLNAEGKKVPYTPDSKRGVNPTDPVNYRRFEEVASAYIAPPHRFDGLGYALGNGVIGLDLDKCRSPHTGEIEPWARAIVARINSYTEISPSGTGVKVFGYGSLLANAAQGKRYKIEIYDRDRYFTVTGHHLPGTPTTVERREDELRALHADIWSGDLITLVRLFDLVLRESDTNIDIRCPWADGHSTPDGGRDAGLKIINGQVEGFHCFHASCSQRKLPDVLKLFGLVDESHDLGSRSTDDFLAYLPKGLYIYRPTGELWLGTKVNVVVRPPSGPSATRWLDRNRAVTQLTWYPGEPEVIQGRVYRDGTWTDHADSAVANLYRAPRRVEIDNPHAELWRQHIEYLFREQTEHLIRWLAFKVQHPGVKINHGLLLGSTEQRIGKDTLLVPVRQAVGTWNFQDIGIPDLLNSNFNGYLESVILRINEVRDLGDVSRQALYEHLKSLTAAPPEMLRVNRKNVPEYYVPNILGAIITSNHKTTGLYLPTGDERFAVYWSDRNEEEMRPRCQRVHAWYERGGIDHVVAYLQQLDVSAFDCKAPPPKTDAWKEIVNVNRGGEDDDLEQAIKALKGPAVLTIADLMAHSNFEFVTWLRDRRNTRAIPARLERCEYVAVQNPDAKNGVWTVDDRRCVIYAKKNLSVREQLDAVNDYLRRLSGEPPQDRSVVQFPKM